MGAAARKAHRQILGRCGCDRHRHRGGLDPAGTATGDGDRSRTADPPEAIAIAAEALQPGLLSADQGVVGQRQSHRRCGGELGGGRHTHGQGSPPGGRCEAAGVVGAERQVAVAEREGGALASAQHLSRDVLLEGVRGFRAGAAGGYPHGSLAGPGDGGGGGADGGVDRAGLVGLQRQRLGHQGLHSGLTVVAADGGADRQAVAAGVWPVAADTKAVAGHRSADRDGAAAARGAALAGAGDRLHLGGDRVAAGAGEADAACAVLDGAGLDGVGPQQRLAAALDGVEGIGAAAGQAEGKLAADGNTDRHGYRSGVDRAGAGAAEAQVTAHRHAAKPLQGRVAVTLEGVAGHRNAHRRCKREGSAVVSGVRHRQGAAANIGLDRSGADAGEVQRSTDCERSIDCQRTLVIAERIREAHHGGGAGRIQGVARPGARPREGDGDASGIRLAHADRHRGRRHGGVDLVSADAAEVQRPGQIHAVGPQLGAHIALEGVVHIDGADAGPERGGRPAAGDGQGSRPEARHQFAAVGDITLGIGFAAGGLDRRLRGLVGAAFDFARLHPRRDRGGDRVGAAGTTAGQGDAARAFAVGERHGEGEGLDLGQGLGFNGQILGHSEHLIAAELHRGVDGCIHGVAATGGADAHRPGRASTAGDREAVAGGLGVELPLILGLDGEGAKLQGLVGIGQAQVGDLRRHRIVDGVRADGQPQGTAGGHGLTPSGAQVDADGKATGEAGDAAVGQQIRISFSARGRDRGGTATGVVGDVVDAGRDAAFEFVKGKATGEAGPD